MAKGIQRQLNKVTIKINKQISNSIDRTDKFSSGLAYEGFNGGYLAAIQDVILALNGNQPNRNGWWDSEE